jgi:hypothetical protein
MEAAVASFVNVPSLAAYPAFLIIELSVLRAV